MDISNERTIFSDTGIACRCIWLIAAWLAVPEDGLPNAQDLAPIATNIADFLKDLGLNPVALTVILWISFLVIEYINSYDPIEGITKTFGVLIIVMIITAAGVGV